MDGRGGGLAKPAKRATISDAAAFLRTAAVVGNGSHIGNRDDADTQCTQSANRGFATRTGALDFDIQVLDTLFNGGTTSNFRGNLRCEWCGFARAFEPLSTRRSPRQCVALAIGDGDDGVVERSVHVSNAIRNIFANFFANS